VYWLYYKDTTVNYVMTLRSLLILRMAYHVGREKSKIHSLKSIKFGTLLRISW